MLPTDLEGWVDLSVYWIPMGVSDWNLQRLWVDCIWGGGRCPHVLWEHSEFPRIHTFRKRLAYLPFPWTHKDFPYLLRAKYPVEESSRPSDS